MVGGDGRVRGEQQRDVDVAPPKGLERQRTSGVERHELPEGQAVDLGESLQAQRALTTLGRAAERELRRDVRQVADRAQRVAGRGGLAHHDGVGVLGRSGGERHGAAGGQCLDQCLVSDLDARAGVAGSQGQEGEGRPGIFGHHIDQAFGEGGHDELPGPRVRHEPHGVALGFQGLPVDLGEDLALHEVERRHRDWALRGR